MKRMKGKALFLTEESRKDSVEVERKGKLASCSAQRHYREGVDIFITEARPGIPHLSRLRSGSQHGTSTLYQAVVSNEVILLGLQYFTA